MVKKNLSSKEKTFEKEAEDSMISIAKVHTKTQEMETIPYLFIQGTNHLYFVCSTDIDGKLKQVFYDFNINQKNKLKIERLFDIDLEQFTTDYQISSDDKYILVKGVRTFGENNSSLFFLFDIENKVLLEQFEDLRITNIEWFGFAFNDSIVYFMKEAEFVTEKYRLDKSKTYKSQMILYSVQDSKIVLVYDILYDSSSNSPFSQPVWDPITLTTMYTVDGIDILAERDHFDIFKKGRINLEKVKELNKDSSYQDYYSCLKEFSIFPKRQNLLHLFAYKDYSDQLRDALQAGQIEYYCDSDGKTPLELASLTQSFSSTNVILGFFKNENCNFIISPRDLQNLMDYQTTYTNDIADKLFTESTFTNKDEVPEFGQIQISLFSKMFKDVKTNDQYKWENASKLLNVKEVNDMILTDKKTFGWQIRKLIDFIKGETEDIRRIEFRTSTIPMNLMPGSTASLNFLQALKNAENSDIFRTCVAKFIDYKWQQTQWMVAILASLYVLQTLILSYHAIATDRTSTGMQVGLLIINIALFLIELMQIKSQGFRSYLDMWNIINFTSGPLLIAYSVDSIYHGKTTDTGNEIMLVGLFLVLINGFSQFRFFFQIGALITMIKEVFSDLRYFLLVFVLALLIFAVPITFVNAHSETMGSMFNDDGCEAVSDKSFKGILLYTYLLGVGGEFNDEIWYGLFLFILLLFSLIVVMLNLLIAVVGDTFDKVQENKIPSSYIEYCTMMIDVEQLLFWRRHEGKEMYLHMCQYSTKIDGEDGGDGMGEWAGKLKSIKAGIKSVQKKMEETNIKNTDELKSQMTDVKQLQTELFGKVQTEMKTEIQTVNEKVESVKESVEKVETEMGKKFDLILEKLQQISKEDISNINLEEDITQAIKKAKPQNIKGE